MGDIVLLTGFPIKTISCLTALKLNDMISFLPNFKCFHIKITNNYPNDQFLTSYGTDKYIHIYIYIKLKLELDIMLSFHTV